MAEIIFLGTGGWVATETRDNIGFLLQSNGWTCLVECPGSIVAKIKKAGLLPQIVDDLLITHIHTDHVYGLPSLVHSLMLEKKTVRLFGSHETIEFCRKLLSLFDLFKETVKYRIDFIPLTDGESVELSPSCRADAFSVPHSPSSLAFELSFNNGPRILYSGDTPIHPPLFKRAEGIEWLVHDCSAPSRLFNDFPYLKTVHTSSLDLGKSAQQAGVQNLVPCHFIGELGFLDKEIKAEIRQNFEGRLIIPHDFQRLTL